MSKGIGVTKSIVLKEFVMTLLSSTRIFHKKSKFIFYFCHIWRSFCRRKTYSGYLQVSKTSFGRMDEPIQKSIHFVINGFHVKKFFSKKKQVLYNFAFFSFLSNCCSFSLMSGYIINYRCSTKVQSNIFWCPKHGFAASKLCSGKF